MKTKLEIRVRKTENNPAGIVTVDAQKINNHQYSDAGIELYIHRAYSEHEIKNPWFTITEKRTGFQLFSPYKLKREALKWLEGLPYPTDFFLNKINEILNANGELNQELI